MQKLPLVGLAVLVVTLAVSYYAYTTEHFFAGKWNLFVFLLFGIGYGIILQRSRFCFASSFRDLFITRNAKLTRGVLLGMLVATSGFAIIIGSGIQTPKVQPLGVHILIGGILFGLGMVIAGGCASGTLYRCGEGYVSLWVALGGTILGMIFLAVTWPILWDNYIQYQPKLWLPDIMGWPSSLLLTILLLVGLLFLVTWWEGGGTVSGASGYAKKSSIAESSEVSGSFPSLSKIYNDLFARAWPAWLGGILLGLLNILEFMFAKPWGITTSESRWAGWFLTTLGVPAESWSYYGKYGLRLPAWEGFWLDSGTLIDLGIILGAFVSAALALEFRVRVGSRKRMLQGLFGGIMMGYGARLAMGCNIGGYFSAIPQLAVNGWLFGFGLLIGGYAGAKLVMRL